MVEKEAGELGTDVGIGGSHLTELPEPYNDPDEGEPAQRTEPDDQNS